MPRIPQQFVARLLNRDKWPDEYDVELMTKLGHYSDRIHTLESRGVFKALIHIVQIEMARKYGSTVSFAKVKNRVQFFRTNFMAFVEYISLPGVMFIHKTKRVRIGANYWSNFTHPNGVSVHLYFIVSLLIIDYVK